jgi:hypothetical protein
LASANAYCGRQRNEEDRIKSQNTAGDEDAVWFSFLGDQLRYNETAKDDKPIDGCESIHSESADRTQRVVSASGKPHGMAKDDPPA